MNHNILIVEANGGLAKETIKCLIDDGFRRFTMACRSEAKGTEAKREILKLRPDASQISLNVVGDFDMNHPKKNEKAINRLNPQGHFGSVFLAVGNPVFAQELQVVEYNGLQIEKNAFQNMLGSHFTLSKLKKYGLLKENVRVVLSGGEGARGLKGMIEKPKFTTPEELRNYVFANSGKTTYNPMNALGVSKY